MSEEQKPRTLREINEEYTALCAQYGDKQFKVRILESECKALANALNRVETEARTAKLAEDESAKNVTQITESKEAGNA